MFKFIAFLVITFIFLGMQSICQTIFIKGMVLDSATKEPLQYASISELKGKFLSITNDKGIFILDNVNPDIVFNISFVGYSSKKIIVNKILSSFDYQDDTLKIYLNPLFSELNEVQIKPLDPSQILNTAFRNFLRGYNDAYIAQVAFRGMQQKNEKYTQWIEGIGKSFFLPIKERTTQKGRSFLSFDIAKATGWPTKGSIPYNSISMANNLLFILPWRPEFYSKKLSYTYQSENSNAEFIKIILSPEKKNNKDLSEMDKSYGFGLNEPELFANTQRTYWLNLVDTTIIAIELFSTKNTSVKYDQNGRNYNYRRYYYEFSNHNSIYRISKIIGSTTFSLPKSSDKIENSYEFYFSDHKQAPENLKYYEQEFGLIQKTTVQDSKNYWERESPNIIYPERYFRLPMKIENNSNKNLKIKLPQFVYSEKAFKDLENAPYFSEFYNAD
jgi:hypothetical protein